VASGLAAAHAVGLLHRDVKPGNVFLESPKGRAKLLDFGLVTPTGGDGRLTEPGLVVGTPAYMSPEQARGHPLDPRSDLFSLGAVLYHLLAGRMPFAGPDSMAVLTALAVDTPPPVAGLNPNVPARLVRLLDRLLSKDPNGRPASADEVVAELKAIERELASRDSNAVAVADRTAPVAIEPPTVADTPAPTKRRRSRTRRLKARRSAVGFWVMIAALMSTALLGGVVLALLFWPQDDSYSDDPETPTTATEEEEDDEPARRPWRENGPDGRPRWMGVGQDGQPKPLPNWWMPGTPLPPGFRDPGPPPPPPRPRD
jgi:serine/threonine protein kinase